MIEMMGQTQNPPAPTVDHIGWSAVKDYQTAKKVLYTYDRPDAKSVLTTYANDPVFTVTTATQNDYPYGSLLVLENWRALQDSAGNPVLDANGRFQKDPAATPALLTMKKDKGYGADYGPNRNGEWEYVAYRPDGSYLAPPQNSFSCAICHLQATQWRDWVFRAGLYFDKGSGAVPAGVIKDYTFVPGVMHVQPGSTITFYNGDVVAHTITDNFASGWTSGRLLAGSSVALTFNVPGEFNFHCAIHPSMKGKIVVDPQ
jgi:plastocyanin